MLYFCHISSNYLKLYVIYSSYIIIYNILHYIYISLCVCVPMHTLYRPMSRFNCHWLHLPAQRWDATRIWDQPPRAWAELARWQPSEWGSLDIPWIPGWWLSPPLWKIWVRQLGWWHSQSMEIHKSHVPNHQPVEFASRTGSTSYLVAHPT
jgi:hypothetical protein